MARKLNKNLLALGSAAIVSIYAVGFARSATTSASAGSVAAPAAAAATDSQPVSAATAIARAIATASPAASQTGAASATAAAAYRDGTYAGSGSSRLGGVSVAVTVQAGRISAVEITGGTTHYPLSRISQLPGEVVSAQGTNIKLVSGATYSSQAFKDAVTQALAQAAAGA